MDWGFYCATCGTSSDSFFDGPDSLIAAYREVRLSELGKDDTIATSALDVHSLIFLARHHRHDVWAECETGVLRLGIGDESGRTAALPSRFGRFLQSPPAEAA